MNLYEWRPKKLWLNDKNWEGGKLLKAINYSWINTEKVIKNSIQCVNIPPWSKSFEQITTRKENLEKGHIYISNPQLKWAAALL